RLQIQLAGLADDDPRRPDLAAREEALLEKHRATWEKDLPAWARRKVVFRGGFPDRIQSTVSDFLKGAPGLFCRAPIQGVHFRAFRARFDELVECPELSHLTYLSLEGCYGESVRDTEAKALASSPHLANLTEMDLGVGQVTAVGARALAGSRYLNR